MSQPKPRSDWERILPIGWFVPFTLTPYHVLPWWWTSDFNNFYLVGYPLLLVLVAWGTRRIQMLTFWMVALVFSLLLFIAGKFVEVMR
ncbi:hypothetical protein MF271_19170 (plasmid) [Deinococcus sp. KNUC1210]|uniref:hypothetical protein n=1 Tax=Deinococcus sp. KNUC1210 TaxID=2917691 RepID=UPI001EEFB340|nr:hypothetical protein [Deinococcus sp. KNUC1210]ULH17298.1 hypothetical protein MF271_18245 [Deinococcus sp. KNUC1210]ULH17441.1 hypothetical protein MF271_19170 [Deinococcus sp. KNUC1210]